jgi:hypothetical protein
VATDSSEMNAASTECIGHAGADIPRQYLRLLSATDVIVDCVQHVSTLVAKTVAELNTFRIAYLGNR